MNAHTSTFGIYKDRKEVKLAVKALKVMGFRSEDISVLNPDRPGNPDLANKQGNQISAGALLGAILGVITAFILTIVGAMMPATRPLYTSLFAPIFGVLLGGVLGAACGALVGIGTPAPASRRYSQYLESGGVLVSVHTDNPENLKRATKILESTGAQDIHELDENSV